MNKIYRIKCRTGCTCCRSDNHYRGLYLTKEEAEARISRFRRGVDYPVASQYSKYGQYTIEESSMEEISGDRLVVGGTLVYNKNEIVHVNLNDGSVSKDDYLESMNEY